MEGFNFLPHLKRKSMRMRTGSSRNSSISGASALNEGNYQDNFEGNYEGDNMPATPMMDFNEIKLESELISAVDEVCNYSQAESLKQMELYKANQELLLKQPLAKRKIMLGKSSLEAFAHVDEELVGYEAAPQLAEQKISIQQILYKYLSLIIAKPHLDFACEQQQRLMESKWYRYFKLAVMFLLSAGICALQLFGGAIWRMCLWTYGLWHSQNVLRTMTRRILWWMTLAKCGDITLFGMVLLATPLLFILASVGFTISMYCKLRDWWNRPKYVLEELDE